jgi:hypothetical protein
MPSIDASDWLSQLVTSGLRGVHANTRPSFVAAFKISYARWLSTSRKKGYAERLRCQKACRTKPKCQLLPDTSVFLVGLEDLSLL